MRECADRGLDRATVLSVLMVEDSADDAQLNALALEQAGYEPRWERVEDAEAMVAASERDDWDIVLCDHQMPRLDSFHALDLLSEVGTDVPCVVVSGTVGDEAAAGVVRAGATDFPCKGNLEHIGAVVDRCLREAQAHRARKAAETALAVSETRFRAALESMPDAFTLLRAVRNDGGEIVDFAPDYVNAALCELTDLSRDELEAASLLELQAAGHLLAFVPAHLGSGLVAEFSDGVETGAPLSRENVVFHNRAAWEGLELTLEISAQKVADGCLVIARDITERSRAERERARLAAIVRSSHDAIMSLDGDLRITSWNSGAEAIYGYAAEEVLGKSSELVIPFGATPESRTLRERGVAGETVDRYETQRLRKDGTLIDVAITSFPLVDAASNSYGAASIASDITERKQAESALAESEQRYREILDTTPDGVWRVDAGHRTDYVNPRIESQANLELLEEYGVDYAQGFAIGRPAPPTPGATRRQAATLSGA
jgi:PAS domain S-box-containing protein